MKKISEISRWLNTIASEMDANDEDGCASLFLDEYRDIALAVGWMGGYDKSDVGTDFASSKSPGYRLNAALVKYNPADCCDLQFMDQPYNPNTGDIYDTMCTLGSDVDWNELARWYRREYANIKREIRKGTLV